MAEDVAKDVKHAVKGTAKDTAYAADETGKDAKHATKVGRGGGGARGTGAQGSSERHRAVCCLAAHPSYTCPVLLPSLPSVLLVGLVAW